MLEAIERIERYTATGRDSLTDDMTNDAVLRCLIGVGEALGAIGDDTSRRIPSLPPHLPKGQRNILVHEYWRIDPEIVWATITRDLPALKADIESLLGAS